MGPHDPIISFLDTVDKTSIDEYRLHQILIIIMEDLVSDVIVNDMLYRVIMKENHKCIQGWTRLDGTYLPPRDRARLANAPPRLNVSPRS
jgi:hypothetical protein